VSDHPAEAVIFPYTTLFRSLMTDRERLDLDYRRDTKELNDQLAAGPRRGGIDQKQFDEQRRRLEARYRSDSAGLDAKDLTLPPRSEEHTSELQSRENLVCRL